MYYVDLTHPLEENMPTYTGDPQFTCTPIATIPKDGYSVYQITLGSHTGTHIDAPSHFIADGRTVDQIPLSQLLNRKAVVVGLEGKVRERGVVRWEDVGGLEGVQAEMVLFRTGWERYYGQPAYFSHPFLHPDIAHQLFQRGVTAVGMDIPSPDETPVDENTPTEFGLQFHKAWLGGGGVIVENVANLGRLVGDGWVVSVVPMNLRGSDGSPVRAYATRVM